ncbi:MAG: DNA repair protein RadA [Candidatus Aminicenantes bacterium]|nr:DNA repair protein RadA [Candidatus Aminicenantes bacterium]
MFICKECGYTSSKWFSQCPVCGSIGSAEKLEGKKRSKDSRPVEIGKLQIREGKRESTGIESFDRVLGGGLVLGSFVLLGGEPGVGKSTLMLQLASNFKGEVIYISGEESPFQIGSRAKRLGVKEGIKLICETEWEPIEDALRIEKPGLAIFDSLQTFYLSSIPSPAGSIAQVKTIAERIFRLSKKEGITSIIVGHVTKEGTIAGPKLLEHIVDVVLYFEGDTSHNFRIIRAVKNRFGATDEIAVFEMKRGRLEEVKNPSGYFLSKDYSPGISTYPAVEGRTPILLEIQSLVIPSSLPSAPRRFSVGIDPYRVGMMIGVLEKYTNLSFASRDIYVNVSGGLRIKDPGADLPTILSLISSYLKIPLPRGAFSFGEVSLSGRILNPSLRELRLKEAKKLGYEFAIVPPGDKIEGLKYFEISHINEARRIFK